MTRDPKIISEIIMRGGKQPSRMKHNLESSIIHSYCKSEIDIIGDIMCVNSHEHSNNKLIILLLCSCLIIESDTKFENDIIANYCKLLDHEKTTETTDLKNQLIAQMHRLMEPNIPIKTFVETIDLGIMKILPIPCIHASK